MTIISKKETLANASLTLCSLCATLLLLELLARIFNWAPVATGFFGPQDSVRMSSNPKLIYELKAGSGGINSDGFFDKERSIPKPPETFRIAVLGDSVAFGAGVEQKNNFPSVLESLLNKLKPYVNTKTKFEVLNFSVYGYNTNNEIEVLKTKVGKYAPDMIILAYTLNDNDPIPHAFPVWLNFTKPVARPPQFFFKFWHLPLTRFLIRHSHLFRFIVKKIWALNVNNAFLGEDIDHHKLVREGFSDLKIFSQKNNIPVIILFHPLLDYETNSDSDKEASIIRDLAVQNGFIFVDMLENYRKLIDTPKRLWIKDAKNPMDKIRDFCHPNTAGHQAIARTLSRVILKTLIKKLPENYKENPVLDKL